MDEIAMLSHVLKDVTTCDKLNVAAIGNVVAQLHVHIVARRRDDAAWPRPVWGVAPARPYEPAELGRVLRAHAGGLSDEGALDEDELRETTGHGRSVPWPTRLFAGVAAGLLALAVLELFSPPMTFGASSRLTARAMHVRV